MSKAKLEREVRRSYDIVDKEIPEPIKVLRRTERELARRPDPKLRESAKRLRHSLAAAALYKARQPSPEGSGGFPERALELVAPRAYRKSHRAALRAGSSGGLGEPEDLTTAITLIAPGGGFLGAAGKKAAQKGVGVVAKEIGEAGARKVEATAAKASARTLNAGSGVRAAGRVASKAARRAAGKDTAKVAEKAARARAARVARRRAASEATARSRAAMNAVPGIKFGKVGVAGTPVVRGHIEAAVENPKKTAKTTARALPGLVTVPVGMAADVGVSGGRAGSTVLHEAGVPGFRGYSGKEILAPVKHIPAEQLAFARQVAKVVTASDPEYVQREVEDSLGLMLPIMAGVGGGAGVKKLSKGRITKGVRRLAERARRRPLGDFRGETPRVLEKQGQRKGEAVRTANARLRIRRETAERAKPIREAAAKAAGEEVVRRGVMQPKGRLRRRRGDLKIRTGDVAGFVVRHALPLDRPDVALAEVRRIAGRMKPLPKGVSLPADKLSTRDVVAFIERNPRVLADPNLRRQVAAYKRQARYARETPGLSPEHSERARFTSVAVANDIPLPEERFPLAVADHMRAHPTRGRQAKDVLRAEARRDRSRARAMRKKAAKRAERAAIMRRELETREKLNKTHLDLRPTKSQMRELAAVRAMERRGMIPREFGRAGRDLRVITPAEGKAISAAKALPARHDRLRDRIDRMDMKAADLRERADRLEEMAKLKHRASKGFDPSLEGEFVKHVQSVLRRQGRPEPEYVHTGRAREAPTFGATGAKLTSFPGKSKFRKGSAEEYGLIEEGLGPLLRESIARPVSRRESYKAMRGFLDDNEFRAGEKNEWTSDEARELFENGVLDRDNFVLVPRQLYNRAYGKFDPDHAAAQLKAALDGEVPEGRRFKLVRRHAAEEFFDQMSNTLVSPKLAKANRATSYLILGTSPAWAAMQVVAEFAQAGVSQPRVLSPRFMKRAVRAYEEMAPEKRQAFDSWVGVTTRTIDRAEDLKLDLKAGDMEAAADAYGVLNSTPYGKFLKGIPTAIQRVDQWKGGRIRALTAIAKIDKDLNGRANRFVRGIGGMHREMGRALQEMRGKSLQEQMEWVSEHPRWAKHYQGYLDDVMGNWSALTKNERVAAQALIFYPFMRMSLRWTFYAFPKRHPIKASMLYYLGQQNANELQKLLGGDPSYFTQWAMVPIDLGNGKKKLVDLSRIAPGSNTLVEAAGGSVEGPKGIAAAKSAQPVLTALGTAIYGVSPLSGKQEPGSGWNALAQLLSLSPPGRALDEATLPKGRVRADGAGQIPVFGSTRRQEALDKLSGKLNDYGQPVRYARTLAMPMIPKDAAKVRDGVMLGRIMKALERNSKTAIKDVSVEYADRVKNARMEGKGKLARRLLREGAKRIEGMEATYSEADNLLDGLFDKYGVPYKKEDKLFLDAYGELYYGSEPESDYSGVQVGGGGGGGISIGGGGGGAGRRGGGGGGSSVVIGGQRYSVGG